MWKIVVALTAIIVATLVVALHGYVIEKPASSYWSERAKLLQEEECSMTGGSLKFQGKERLANQALMDAKKKELDDGFNNPNAYLPGQNFLTVANQIRESRVFRIIKEMPKGAVLHAHDTAIVSSEYVYWNVTFRPNLYVCEGGDGALRLRFFDKPSAECDWRLLSEVRKSGGDDNVIDNRIAGQLTMDTQNPEQTYTNVDTAWQKFMSIFDFITPMLTYRPVYEDYFYQGLLELYNDNVLYLELRTTLSTLYDLDGKKYGPLEVARIYKKVTDRFIQDHPDFIGVKLIYAPLRKVNERQLDQYLKIAQQLKAELPDFVAGFDLVGQEDKGEPLVKFAQKLQFLDDNAQVFYHAGETNWNGMSTDENLIDAVILNTKRIGHGYALVKHPKVLKLAREKNIAIEISPISNQVLALVKDLRNHPASILFAEDYPVVISNDDPGLWGAQGLSYDFYEAFVGIMSKRADLRSLKKLAMNSITYSSLSEDEKSRAMNVWNQKWQEFVEKLAKVNI